MTYEELQAKGFEIEIYPFDDSIGHALGFNSWGREFQANGKSLDDAAANLWADFCDFINGRSE